MTLREMIIKHLAETLRETGGKRREAARRLQMSPRWVQNMIRDVPELYAEFKNEMTGVRVLSGMSFEGKKKND